MTHPTKLNKPLNELAKEIANLRYDYLADFLCYLENELIGQWVGDFHNGRKKLAEELLTAAHDLYRAKQRIDKAWEISKSFMEE